MNDKLLEPYLNYNHGLELVRDLTDTPRGNENGILFLVEYFILLDMLDQLTSEHANIFKQIVNDLEVEEGLYDRGKLDRYGEQPVRSISHDNISAISAGSYLFGTEHAKQIADYGLKHFFVYDNNGQEYLPMNPGNYTPWLYLGQAGSIGLMFIIKKVLEFIFLPFFLINFTITMLKPKRDTSSKLLYLVELYAMQKTSKFYKFLFDIYMKKIKKQYVGLHNILLVYFHQDIYNPINVKARELAYKKGV